MKKLIFICAATLYMVLSTVCAYADDIAATTEILDGYAESYGGELQAGADMLKGSVEDVIPGFDAQELLGDVMSGRMSLSVGSVLQRLFMLVWREFFAVSKLMFFVLALAMLSAYLSNLHSGIDSEGVSQVSYFACYVMIAGIAAAAFCEVIACSREAVENMALFMQVLIPLIVTALLSSGAVLSAAALEPTLLAVIEIMLTLIKTVFIPLTILSAAVGIVNGLSDKFNADKLIQLINRVIKWGFSAMLIVFVGVAGVQSLSSTAADGLSIKVSKFAASNLIPVVGGILADSVETLAGCGSVLKNAVGITGVIVIAAVAAMPLIKIAASMLVFRLTAAVAQPIADAKIIKGISSLAESIGVLFSMTASVAVMFILVTAIVARAGSVI